VKSLKIWHKKTTPSGYEYNNMSVTEFYCESERYLIPVKSGFRWSTQLPYVRTVKIREEGDVYPAAQPIK